MAKLISRGVKQRATLATARRSGWMISGVCRSCGETKRLQVNELVLRGRLSEHTTLAEVAPRLTCTACGKQGGVELKYMPPASPWHPGPGSPPGRNARRSKRRRRRSPLSPLYWLFGRRRTHRLLLLGVVLLGLYIWQGMGGVSYVGNARVVDGDTIRIEGRAIRIWGIAAPELDEPKGQASKRQMAHLVAGKTVTCEQVDTDQYQRAVSRCDVNGQDLGALMVASGLARDCPRYSFGRYYSDEASASRALPLPPYCNPLRRLGF